MNWRSNLMRLIRRQAILPSAGDNKQGITWFRCAQRSIGLFLSYRKERSPPTALRPVGDFG